MNRGRLCSALLVYTCALTAIYPLLSSPFQKALYDAAGVPLALAVTMMLTRAPARLRLAAALAAAGAWLLVAGAVTWDLGTLSGGEPAGGSADLCFILGSAGLLGAVVLAVAGSFPDQRSDLAMLVLVVAPLTAALAWALQSDPDGTMDRATLAALLQVVLSFVALAVSVRFLSSGGWRNQATVLLLGGMALRTLGDLGYVTLSDYAAFKTGALLDLAWMAGKLLLAAALVHPALPALLAVRPAAPPRLGEGQVASMVGLVLLTPAVSTLPFSDRGARLVVAGAGALAGALAVVRLVMLTRKMGRARQRLSESEARYRELYDNNSTAMLLVDPVDGSIVSANPAAVTFYGWSLEDLTRMRISDINMLGAEKVAAAMAQTRAERRGVFEFPHRRADGSVRDVEVSSGPVTIDGRDLLYSTVHDVTPLREERRARRAAEDLAFALLEQGVIGVGLASGDDHLLLRANERLAELLQADPKALTGRGVTDLTHPDDRELMASLVHRVATGAVATAEQELRLRRLDGTPVDVLATIAPLPTPGDAPADQLVMVQDISDRRAAEQRLRHLAMHDPLTGLANRTLLLERIGHAFDRTAREPEPLTVVFLDLDRFKATNDGFGHDVGDQLLQEVGRRLAGAVRPSDTLARVGGDEFAVFCENTDVEGAQALAQRLLSVLHPPFLIATHRLYVSGSFGVALARPGSTAAMLLRDADLAMYRAKERGRNRVVVFDPSLHEAQLAEAQLDNSLYGAITNGEIRVFYQPILTLADMMPVAVEALVRWEHPTLGLLGANDFVPAAETNGLILPIGRHVLHEACRQAGQWLRSGIGVQVTVNLSADQFRDPGLPSAVRSALQDAQLPPELLALEMTETLLMDDAETTLAVLRALSAVGVRLLVDDFGTGYSSLAYLKQFPVHGLKVDRSFVDGLPEQSLDRSIVTAITQLAHALGLAVTAEGIERPEQVRALADLGCHTGQGFLFARPAPGHVVEQYLRANLSALA